MKENIAKHIDVLFERYPELDFNREYIKKAYELLESKPTVIDIPTIKPIDKELIIETAKTHDVIVTVEEHNIYGGLGSAVSEVLAPEGIACRQYMLGMQDTFGRSGKPKDLLDYYGLDAKHIAEKIQEIVK